MRKPDESEVIALLVADIHLSERPPIARSAEPDWFGAMARVLHQLTDLQAEHDVPIVCAGDVFDRWNPSPRLINFAIEYLPEMCAIAGQHDLRHHNIETINETAFWTLVEAGTIYHLTSGPPCNEGEVNLHGFSWGEELKPIDPRTDILQVAIIHRYCWTIGCSYSNAPEDQHVRYYREKLKGFDVAVFGDNHQGFYHETSTEPAIYNCGCLIRRSYNEIDYKPAVGLLMSDGKVQWIALDCSQDKWLDRTPATEVLEATMEQRRAFLQELKELETDSLDFIKAVERYCKANGVSKSIRQMALEAIEGDE